MVKYKGILIQKARFEMAWNQPTDKKPIATKKKGTWQRGLFAGVIVVLLCVVIFWMMRAPVDSDDDRAVRKGGAIQEVTSAKSDVKEMDLCKSEDMSAQVAQTDVERPATNAAPRKLKLWEKGIRVPKTKPAPPKRFKYDAEEDIAFFLETEPGETVFGEIPFDHRFIAQLKESFKEPVEIKPDDSDDLKELKKAIQETKDDLQKRMEAGEDIAKLFADSRHQLIELGNYRRDVINSMMEMAKSDDTANEDFDAYVEAVNAMLEQKGVKPFKPTPMTYKMLELSARKRNQNK